MIWGFKGEGNIPKGEERYEDCEMFPQRYLIVNADDFGQSQGVNRGVIAAHEHGIVTSASLMVRWPAAIEAAAIHPVRIATPALYKYEISLSYDGMLSARCQSGGVRR